MKNNNPFVPIKTYLNAYIEKSIIFSDNKSKSGVYRWVNLVNKKCYIGSAINLTNRFHQYYSNNYLFRNTCMLICRALIKHG
jgi:hypothetical protein